MTVLPVGIGNPNWPLHPKLFRIPGLSVFNVSLISRQVTVSTNVL
jgi:hypothetical protein